MKLTCLLLASAFLWLARVIAESITQKEID